MGQPVAQIDDALDGYRTVEIHVAAARRDTRTDERLQRGFEFVDGVDIEPRVERLAVHWIVDPFSMMKRLLMMFWSVKR